jgi:pimeloyl-ACP methyl ester carboxylesterase
MRLHVHEWGEGPRVVLVHGVVLGGREAWRAQRPLTERWTLLAPDRPGHGKSPDAPQDFESEGHLIADQLLDEPGHLVGYSYGAIAAMLAAAERPEHVWSLTVVEPPAMSVARGMAAVDRWEAETRAVFASASGEDLPSLVGRFFDVAGVPLPVPDPLPEALERGARALVGARPPGEAEIPLAALHAAEFPMLVISGGHMDGYELVCDAIADGTGAAREVLPGLAHLVPDQGAPFNELLDAFMTEATPTSADAVAPASASSRAPRGSKAVP